MDERLAGCVVQPPQPQHLRPHPCVRPVRTQHNSTGVLGSRSSKNQKRIALVPCACLCMTMHKPCGSPLLQSAQAAPRFAGASGKWLGGCGPAHWSSRTCGSSAGGTRLAGAGASHGSSNTTAMLAASTCAPRARAPTGWPQRTTGGALSRQEGGSQQASSNIRCQCGAAGRVFHLCVGVS